MFLDHLSLRSGRRSVTYLPFRPATSFEQRAAAFQLVYESYLQSKLGSRNVFKMRVTPFQLLKTSQIFIASEQRPAKATEALPRYAVLASHRHSRLPAGGLLEEVVSTVTLVKDGHLGIPMDVMFGDEVNALRREGRTVAEVACLADAVSDPRRFLHTFTQLTRLMAQFSRYEGVQNLLISVHPRHAKFYARYFGFRPMSDRVVDCPHAKDHPAIALNLDFELYDMEQPSSWQKIFGIWEPKEKLRPVSIPAGEHQFWREVSRVGCAESGHLLARIDDQPPHEELRNQKQAVIGFASANPSLRREPARDAVELLRNMYETACSVRPPLVASVPSNTPAV